MGVKEKLHSFVDSIFQPIISFLDLCIEKIQGINMVVATGIDVGRYLSVFGDMPSPWQKVIISMLASVTLLGSLLIFRSAMRMYYSIKEGVKWW
ncbi:hypothetical protein ACQVQT_28680 [Bacillus paranthracis]|uniref:hypothetical protein n=1 Tax=Bacillus cereus group TaxID=86661 RepID=UPI00062D9437|nr:MULTISPECIES: hypothetical protein [Bacillus cereus group]MBQ2636368.1 hypothetical protein [Methanobrevibacter sp.]MRB06041.1 hypothetical protein [Bacillus thuringiensis]KLA15603.1 hypothetical protein B4078_5496 [Bacillus cereus]KXI93044.1 hypothetical protein ACS47_04115 [Bacillus cereus]MCU5568117.1 hypothetical protein [Bacillus paranthracis]